MIFSQLAMRNLKNPELVAHTMKISALGLTLLLTGGFRKVPDRTVQRFANPSPQFL
jgi:hypothetical protein